MIRNFPGMVAVCGSIPAALFLDYALQQEEGPGGWFTRTLEEIELATSLSPQAQKTVRKALIEKGLLSEKKEGMPARTYWNAHWARLEEEFWAWRQASCPYTTLSAVAAKEGEGYPVIVKKLVDARPLMTVAEVAIETGWSAYETYKAVYRGLRDGVLLYGGRKAEPTPQNQEMERAAQILKDAGLRPSLAAEALRLATPEVSSFLAGQDGECDHGTPHYYSCDDCSTAVEIKPKTAPRTKLDDSPVVLQIPVQGLRQYPVRQALLDQISRTFPGVDVNWYAERVRQYHNSAIAKRCTYDGVPARIRNFISKDIAEERVRMLPGKEWVADAKQEEVKLYEPRPVLFGTVLKASSDGKRWLARQEWEREFPLVQLDWRE